MSFSKNTWTNIFEKFLITQKKMIKTTLNLNICWNENIEYSLDEPGAPGGGKENQNWCASLICPLGLSEKKNKMNKLFHMKWKTICLYGKYFVI